MGFVNHPLALVCACVLTGAAGAQTVTVTTSADVVDVNTSTATLADLPGPDGVVSFREALAVSDNEPGHQTVAFAIPQSDWYLPSIFPGQVLLQGSFSWSAFDAVTIDGTSQTAFTGDTFPGGHEIVLYGLGLNLNGDGSVVFGLHESDVTVLGSNSVVRDNTGGMYITVLLGNGSVVEDNEAWTIKLQQTNDNVVVRNTTDRIRITGSPSALATNNRIGGPDPADRNFITGWGNYGEHGVPGGTTVELFYTQGTLIENNYIGTTPDGMAIGNQASTVGIGFYDVNYGATVRDNLIAIHAVHATANVDYGAGIYVELSSGGGNIDVVGNTIGLDAAGQPVLGGVNGILVSRYAFEDSQAVRIGGTAPGEGNVIAGHLSTGVLMMWGFTLAPPTGVRLSGNSIFGNGEGGIDLTPNTWTFGPTANDAMDADSGANGLQNYPVLTSARRKGGVIRVTGSLHSEPLQSYTVEFFASPACDPSGFGQGQVFLGSTNASTDAAGNAPFVALVPALAPVGWVLTSTATLEPIGATSEFSACLPIQGRFKRELIGHQ